MLIKKSQPAPQDVHVDEVLTNIAIAYIQEQTTFLAPKVFPIVPVAKQSDKYIVWDKNDWFRDEAKKRADSTESAGGGFNFSRDSYFADVYAFHKDVGMQTVQNQDAGVDVVGASVRFVTQRLLLRQEVQFVTDFFTTGVWTGSTTATDITVANTWDDYASSDPLADIDDQKEAMLQNTGFEPNTLTVGYSVWKKLKNHPDIVDRIKYGGGTPAIATEQIVAQVLGVANLYVARSIKATNLEAETAAYAFNFGKNALLSYVPARAGREVPSAGYIFSWDYAGFGGGIGVDSFDIREKKTTRYEAESAWDNKVTAADLGVFFTNVVV